MSSDNKLRVVLLRHGETVYNIEKRLQSPKDSLTEKGKLQITNLKANLDKFNFNYILSSDEVRALESANIISLSLKKDFEVLPEIREKSSGDFSDKLVKEVDWSEVKGSFLNKKISNGENIKEVIMRALEFFKKINSFNQGDDILVVSHGTFLRVLFCLIFNKNIEDYLLNYEFPNASYIIIFRSEDGKWNLEYSSLIKKEEKHG